MNGQSDVRAGAVADSLTTVDAMRYEHGVLQACRDPLTVEHPLQIRINGKNFSVTMRTPGDDHYLVKGLLFTEAVTVAGHDACTLQVERHPESDDVVAIDVAIPEVYLCDRVHEKRSLLASAACGMCGQREFDAATLETVPLKPAQPLPMRLVAGLMNRMWDAQRTFRQTGSTHAAALFDADGQLLAIFEDVGRHNAVDKVVGCMLDKGLRPAVPILAVSGRISFEIVSKAYRAGIPYLLAVSAPSSFAVEMSQRWGMTLAGYCRDGRATIYSHPENAAV